MIVVCVEEGINNQSVRQILAFYLKKKLVDSITPTSYQLFNSYLLLMITQAEKPQRLTSQERERHVA